MVVRIYIHESLHHLKSQHIFLSLFCKHTVITEGSVLNVRFNNMIVHYFDKVESYSFAPALRKHHHINIFNNKRQPSET